MSSSSPEPPKPADPVDKGEHTLLGYACTCGERPTTEPPTSPRLLRPPFHATPVGGQQVHVHVHTSPPPTKLPPASNCSCHLQESCESGVESDSTNTRKLVPDDRIEISAVPPALPPRPPPRPRVDGTSSLGSRYRATGNPTSSGIRKYVFCCCVFGGLSTILGALFLAVYFLLRSYTSTLSYFETIPTFIPATMLILTGLCVISLARRKNRYTYFIKVCGICCLVCALTCVLVTITTTVIHMNRLQTLRECVYTQRTRTCVCYSNLIEVGARTDNRPATTPFPEKSYNFNATPDCEVIHGALYTCLRAIFGLSVSGILICIFSCMLVYQLLSHERKKMYWEQLELRCRSFYQQQATGTTSTHSSNPPIAPVAYCNCCEECRYPAAYPWDGRHPPAFWTPGRVGNLYSPNPGEEAAAPRERTGWNWRRLPWTRAPDAPRRDSPVYQGGSTTDSQYGFGGRPEAYGAPAGGVYVWGPPPPYPNPKSPARRVPQSPARYRHLHHEAHCAMARRPPDDDYENAVEVHEPNDASGEHTDTSSAGARTLPVQRKTKKRPETFEPEPEPRTDDPEKKNECRFLPRLQGVENAAFQKQEPRGKPEATESEVYFADVSSCCNTSVRNDGHESSLYDEALETHKARLLVKEGEGGDNRETTPSTTATEDEDYLVHRQMSARARMPFPLPSHDSHVTDSCVQLLPKDVSQNSLCSTVTVQTPLSDAPDDRTQYFQDVCDNHRTFNNNAVDQFLAPDAQYEVVQEDNSTKFRPNANFYNKNQQSPRRRNLGSNISNLIQNLQNEGAGRDDDAVQWQACHSDATIDSGWHSGSEKLENRKQEKNDGLNV